MFTLTEVQNGIMRNLLATFARSGKTQKKQFRPMANHHTNVQATNTHGHQLSIHHTATDSPILPAANLQQLKEIDPSLVDWVKEQTVIEASHRRSAEDRLNWFIFLERISGVVAGAGVAIIGLLIGGYLILHGHDWAGVTLCGATLGTIVSVLVTRTIISRPHEPTPSKKKIKTTRPVAPKK